MTFGEALNTLFDDLFEKRSDKEVERRLKNYINRGYRELAKRQKLTKIIKVTPSNGIIKKPNGCIKINTITVNDMVIDYIENNGRINIDTDNEVEVEYYYLPEMLEDLEDETITNSANDEFILSYAKWLYFMADNMYQDSDMWKREYEALKIIKQPTQIRQILNIY